MALPRWGPLVQLGSLAAASWPFAQAARLLAEFAGAWVSPEWVRQSAHTTGLAQAVVASRLEVDAEQVAASSSLPSTGAG